MPARTDLVETLINTKNVYQDALSNIKQLLVEHIDCLKIEDAILPEESIVTYDEIRVFSTPWISIVFDTARVTEVRIGKCMTLEIDVTIYMYFQSLSFGNDTFPFIGALYRLTDIFIVHPNIYNFVTGGSGQVQITNSALVGRLLDADTFLTGQLNLTLPVRSCGGDHDFSCP